MSALTHKSIDIESIPEVEIKNDSGNPVPVSGTVTTTPSGTQDVNIVSSVELEIKNDTGNPIPVNGTVNIGTMPEVEISNDAGNPIPVYTAQVAGTPDVDRYTIDDTVAVEIAPVSLTRSHVIIHNESGTLYVKLGAAASATDYTYKLFTDSTVDIGIVQDAAVTARKASGSSAVQVTLIDY